MVALIATRTPEAPAIFTKAIQAHPGVFPGPVRGHGEASLAALLIAPNASP
jgi:hypothetical protein